MSHESAAKIAALRPCVDSYLVRMTRNLDALTELSAADIQLKECVQQLSYSTSWSHQGTTGESSTSDSATVSGWQGRGTGRVFRRPNWYVDKDAPPPKRARIGTTGRPFNSGRYFNTDGGGGAQFNQRATRGGNSFRGNNRNRGQRRGGGRFGRYQGRGGGDHSVDTSDIAEWPSASRGFGRGQNYPNFTENNADPWSDANQQLSGPYFGDNSASGGGGSANYIDYGHQSVPQE